VIIIANDSIRFLQGLAQSPTDESVHDHIHYCGRHRVQNSHPVVLFVHTSPLFPYHNSKQQCCSRSTGFVCSCAAGRHVRKPLSLKLSSCVLDRLAPARRGWATAANPPTKQAFTTNRARERAYHIMRSAMIDHGIFDRAGAGIVDGGLAQSQ
jgi:hypothetical protein